MRVIVEYTMVCLIRIFSNLERKIQGLSKSLHFATATAFPTVGNACIHARATLDCWYDEECHHTSKILQGEVILRISTHRQVRTIC